MHDFLGIGIELGRFIVILIFGYFTVKWAVKNGIKQYYEEKEQTAKMEAQLEEYNKEQKQEEQ